MELTPLQIKTLEIAPIEELESALIWSVNVIDSWESVEDLLGQGIWQEIMKDVESVHKAREQIQKFKEMNEIIKATIIKRKEA